MRNYLTLLASAFILMYGCKNEDEPKKKESPVAAQTKTMYSISSNGIGEIKIGDNYDKVKKYCEKMNFRVVQKGGKEIQEDAGLYIYQDTTLVILIGNKNWGLAPYIVKTIDIYSADFKTSDNVHVGMNMNDLHKIFPNVKLEQNDIEFPNHIYFCPEKYQSFRSAKPNIVFSINIQLNNSRDNEKSIEEINNNLENLDATVGSITIFDWN